MAEDKFGLVKINLSNKLGASPSTKLMVNKKLHRREHVLADDLSRKLGEPKRFGAYLGIAMKYPEEALRRVAAESMESYRSDKTGKTHPGKLFFYKIGEYAKNFTKPKPDIKKKGAKTRAGRNKELRDKKVDSGDDGGSWKR